MGVLCDSTNSSGSRKVFARRLDLVGGSHLVTSDSGSLVRGLGNLLCLALANPTIQLTAAAWRARLPQDPSHFFVESI